MVLTVTQIYDFVNLRQGTGGATLKQLNKVARMTDSHKYFKTSKSDVSYHKGLI